MSQKRYCIRWGEHGMMSYVYAETALEAINKLITDIVAINNNPATINIKAIDCEES